MTHVIRVRAEAEDDIHEAAVWYERQRAHLGHDFLDAVESMFSRISENPLQFPAVYRECRRALLSRFPFGDFFRVEGDMVVVLAVTLQAATQLVGVNEHNNSLKADAVNGTGFGFTRSLFSLRETRNLVLAGPA